MSINRNVGTKYYLDMRINLSVGRKSSNHKNSRRLKR